ncbi:MAG TPA: hypothetical protein DEA08_24420 [Planctomycetes bacterium]|nr:hypothetical protein [Planctomycetota bacterium]
MTTFNPTCGVCKKPVVAFAGGILANNFIVQLNHEIAEAGNWVAATDGEQGAQVNAVTLLLLDANKEALSPRGQTQSFKQHLLDRRMDRAAHKNRLRKILDYQERVAQGDAPELKDVYLLLHDRCAPQSWLDFGFWIPLERINDHQKALGWTMQLAGKHTTDLRVWVQTLEGIFGRIAV